MFGVMQKQVERYPKGTRLKLISMEDPHGEVDFIDDAGQIHMKWETGSCLALIPEVDRFRRL